MCKASQQATHTRDAQRGDKTQLGISEHGLAQFQLLEHVANPAGTLTCPCNGQMMSLSGIPAYFQEKYGVPGEISAVFIENGDDISDSVAWEKLDLDLWEMAYEAAQDGGLVEVTMHSVLSEAELKVVLDAIRTEESVAASIAHLPTITEVHTTDSRAAA